MTRERVEQEMEQLITDNTEEFLTGGGWVKDVDYLIDVWFEEYSNNGAVPDYVYDVAEYFGTLNWGAS